MMTRWIWAALAALVVIAVGLFFWQTGDLGKVAAPFAQAPPAAPAAPTAAQAPSTNVAAATAGKEAVAPPAPAASAPAPADDKERTAQPTAPTAVQTPATTAAAPAGGNEPTAPTAAQAAATNAPATTSEKEPATATVAQAPATPVEKESTAGPPTPAAQTPAANAAAPTAEKEPAPAASTVAQTPATNEATPTGEKESAAKPNETRPEINAKATAELASLKPGFGPKDLIAALNDSEINFRSDSAEVPASAMSFLQNAAEDLKQMPPGNMLEIAGYTDNTGDAALNVALSQRRADAVRDALVKSGANADMLVAKGYGSADPVASNDTPEGRLRNRRIEYRLVKTP
jgi:outer membrane protein OmpA-like peptidoglycan-associated protein